MVGLNSENGEKMAGVFDNERCTVCVPIDALIASMCRSARGVRLADRATLYAQGEPAHRLFLIMDGVKRRAFSKMGRRLRSNC
jgi:hypothetical protein